MAEFKKIICVDFDGVLHSYTSGWQGVANIPDPPVPGAIKWLESLLPCPDELGMAPAHNGPVAVIYSSRSKSWRGRRAMKKWLIQQGMHPSYFKEKILKFPIKKPAAWLTIDDRVICFTGEFPSIETINSFKPWNKE
jgi:hypothetical protein